VGVAEITLKLQQQWAGYILNYGLSLIVHNDKLNMVEELQHERFSSVHMQNHIQFIWFIME
jgi:hypothetical protein